MEVSTEQFGSLGMIKLRAEHTRTYVYPNEVRYTVVGVTHLHVSRRPGGDSHRLRDADGNMYYVTPGWIAIEFPGLDGWTL